MTEDRPGAGEEALRHALRSDADRAARTDTDLVWTRISHGVANRRRRRQELAGTGAAALAVIAVTVGVANLGLSDDPDQARPVAPPPVTAPATAGPTAPPTPSPTPPTAAATPGPSDVLPTPLAELDVTVTPSQAREAYLDAGYDEDDAWQLVEVWRWGDVDDVEVVAGARLLRGEPLPLQPGQTAAEAAEDEAWPLSENLLTYYNSGFDAADADALAESWGEQADLVRMLIGELARAGELPLATN